MVTASGSFYRDLYDRDNNHRFDRVTSNEVMWSQSTSDFESGSWIDFPDGSKFRRSTNYGRSSLTRHLGNSEYTDFNAAGGFFRWRSVTGPGGFSDGNYTSPNWAFSLNDEMGIASINSPPGFQTMERNEAVTKSLNQLADQKANMGENLATLRQTINLFRNPCKALYDGLVRMRRDKSMAPYLADSFYTIVRKGVDRKVASKYLEYVYGFKPLMQDIYSLSEFAKEVGAKPLLLNARGSSRRELSAIDKKFDNVSTNRLENWTSIRGNSRTSCSIWAKISDKYSGVRTLNQLGLVNPASLIWELTPYSFVVDWFLPVGPVLNAFTAPAGLDFVDGSCARRVSASWRYSDARSPTYSDIISSSPATGKFEYEGYKREHLLEFPRPGIYFDSDPLRLQNDKSDRSLKALALAIMSLR